MKRILLALCLALAFPAHAVDITLRSVKGSALTFAEVDANFTNLKSAVEATTWSILRLSNLTTNGYVKTGSANGTLSVAATIPYSDLTGTPSLATVATSGAYSDLTGAPTINTLLPTQSGHNGEFLKTNGTVASWGAAGSGSGDVVGPASAADGRVVLFDGTTGKLIKDSGLTLSGTNTGDQTTISGNAGTATALATARAIYGNSFDGTAALTQIIGSTYGGTGNGFTKFTGPASAERTFTLPNSDATLLYSGGALGTPSSGTATNLSGTAASLTAGTVTTNANLTGPITSSGNATSVGSQTGTGNTFAMSVGPTFTGHVTVEGVTATGATGTGKFVFDGTPTLATPVLGVATATSINKMAITAPATSSTLAVANGKTLTASNTLTLAGTDSTTMTFPSTSATIARTDAANTFTGTQTVGNLTDSGLTAGRLATVGTAGLLGTDAFLQYDTAGHQLNVSFGGAVGDIGVAKQSTGDVTVVASNYNNTSAAQAGVYAGSAGGTLNYAGLQKFGNSCATAGLIVANAGLLFNDTAQLVIATKNAAPVIVAVAGTAAANEAFRIIGAAGSGSVAGNIGIGAAGGVTNPTAYLHIKAGTATAGTAPFKLTSGTNLTTAEPGAMEYNGTNLFFTRSGTTRENVITTSAVNSVSPTSPNRTITVVIDGTTYYISAKTTND